VSEALGFNSLCKVVVRKTLRGHTKVEVLTFGTRGLQVRVLPGALGLTTIRPNWVYPLKREYVNFSRIVS
jgi:hypothetical protein